MTFCFIAKEENNRKQKTAKLQKKWEVREERVREKTDLKCNEEKDRQRVKSFIFRFYFENSKMNIQKSE